MSTDNHFHSGELSLQQRWDTSQRWDDARRKQLLHDHIPKAYQQRIEEAPFFFLATSNDQGYCDCSFKGGGPGLIHIIHSRQFAWPDFDGNGAFMSLGNILLNPYVGCLFIDFSDGARLRINGKATIHEQGPLMDYFPNSARVISVDILQVVPNCPAHIPKLVAIE